MSLFHRVGAVADDGWLRLHRASDMVDAPIITFLQLPADAIGHTIAYAIMTDIGVVWNMRLVAKELEVPVQIGCRCACASLLGCEPSEVEQRTRASGGEDLLRTAAFTFRSHFAASPVAATNHTLYAVRGGTQLLACGANDCGQLGVGVVSQFSSTVYLPSPTFDTAAFLAKQQKNNERCDPSTPAPVLLPPAAELRSVAAGRAHSIVCTASGEAFLWGQRIGAAAAPPAANPQPIPFGGNAHVVQVAAGQLHCALLLRSGAVYCLGVGDCGALGEGEGDCAMPRLVRLPEAARAVAAGGYHTLAVSASACRHVFGWGSAACGQLGMMSEAVPKSTGELAEEAEAAEAAARAGSLPPLPRPPRRIKLAVVPSPTALVGFARDAALSATEVEDGAQDVDEEEQPRALPPCAAIAAGSHHSLLLTQRGLVLSCGKVMMMMMMMMMIAARCLPASGTCL